MESTKESQSDSEGESVAEENEEEEEGEEGEESRSEVVDGSEREELEGDKVGVEDVVVGGDEPGREDEESSGSAKSQRANAREKVESPSREAPRSGSSSPTSQITSQLENRFSVNASKEKEIRKKAAVDAFKGRAREKQKYHSRRGAERTGRPKGSKAKQDNRVKVDRSGLWD
jgi:RIO kinase 2